jgi:hypothetical protein
VHWTLIGLFVLAGSVVIMAGVFMGLDWLGGKSPRAGVFILTGWTILFVCLVLLGLGYVIGQHLKHVYQ